MKMRETLKSLKGADLNGKKVLVRVDLDVPMDYDNLRITDDTRIQEALPTIKYLMQHGARVILASHLGHPEGVDPKYSLKPLVPRLSELLEYEVKMANDCIGQEVKDLVAEIPGGGVLLLENVRFYVEEMFADDEFGQELASLADLFVNDAFGLAHKPYTSTTVVAHFLKPAVAGFLMQKELEHFIGVVAKPRKPFAAIIGGSELSTKICLIDSLLDKVDILLLGGGIVFPFYQARGISVGSSLTMRRNCNLPKAKSLMRKAKEKGVELVFPDDVVIADMFGADAFGKVVEASEIPDGWMGLDIGPAAIKSFCKVLDTAKTICWIGPMGVFEYDRFTAGTEGIAKKLAELTRKGVKTVIAGHHTIEAVEKMGIADKMTYISKGRDASLEFLKGQALPGLLALNKCVT